MSTYRFKRQVSLRPEQLGFNALVCANGVEKTSSTFDLTGVDELGVGIIYTNVDNNGTNIRAVLDISYDQGTVTDWMEAQSESVTGGIGTTNDYKSDHAIGAADEKYALKYKNLNAYQGRIRVTVTGGTTNTVTLKAIKAF